MAAYDWITDFLNAVLDKGLVAPESVVANGEYQRYSTNGRIGDKAGWYRLFVLSNGGVAGSFGDWRAGVMFIWNSKHDNPVVMRKLRQEADKVMKQAERDHARERLPEVRREWASFPPITPDAEHPYLIRKGHKPIPRFMAVHGDMIVVPMQDKKGDICSYQQILPNGKKLFAKGVPSKGLFLSLGPEPAPGAWLYIVEGLATGMSVFVLVGCATVIAFSASNMPEVARTMHERYPQAKIVIAGDRGDAGEKNTERAAREVDGYTAIPPPDVADGLSDWNDMHLLDAGRARSCLQAPKKWTREEPPSPVWEDAASGLKSSSRRHAALKSADAEAEAMQEIPERINPQWQDKLLCDRRHNALPIDFNVMLCLQHAQEFAFLFALDEFKGKQVVTRRPPWVESPTNGAGDDHKWPANVRDEDALFVTAIMQSRYAINVSRTMVAACMDVVAWQNRFDSLQLTLDSLSWDGAARINTWLIDICGVEDTAYTRAVARAFLISAVARAYAPGCRVDTVLVLEGAQGMLKSTLIEVLGMGFAGDIHVDPTGSKTTAELFHGKWILEFAELAGLKRAESESMKAFVSRRVDTYRAAYARSGQDHPRRVVFVGSANDDAYLQDITGNRRWWPVRATRIDVELARKTVRQLWAEAIVAYRAGEKWWLDKEQEQAAVTEQKLRVAEELWEAPIHDWLQRQPEPLVTTAREVLVQALKLNTREQDALSLRRATNALANLGYKRTEYRTKDRQRLYIHGDKLDARKKVIDLEVLRGYLIGPASVEIFPEPDFTARH